MQNFKYLFAFLTLSFFSTSYADVIKVEHIRDSGITNLTNAKRQVRLWTPKGGTYFGSDASGIMAAPLVSGESDIPSNRFTLSSFHLGAIPTVAAGWPIRQYTGLLMPGPVSSGPFVNQVSYSNEAASASSAFQASGLVWGAYMRSSDIADGEQKMAITYKKNYDLDSAPIPFASSKDALLVQTKFAVSRYLAKGTGVGQASINIVLQDISTQKKLTLITRLFDTRGFTVAADDGSSAYGNHPNTPRIGKGLLRESAIISSSSSREAIFYSHLGHDTLYNSFQKGSVMSQTGTWTVNKNFFYTIKRDQFTKMIVEANNLLVNPDDVKYSTLPEKYKMIHVDIRMEGSGVQQNSLANTLEMSFKGDFFKVYTESWLTRGNALWMGTSDTPGKFSMGTAVYPGITYDKLYLVMGDLGFLHDGTLSSTNQNVEGFTGYNPGANTPESNKQLSVSAERYNASAIQGSGKEWAGYMRSADKTSPKNITIRGGYIFPDVRPFRSEYGNNAVLHVKTQVALPLYTATGTAANKAPLGYAILNLYFQDMRSRKALLVTARIFDPRGYRAGTNSEYTIGPAGLPEVAARCATGEMGVGTHFSHGTKYITKDLTSASSSAVIWSNLKDFGFTINRDQFTKVIADSNHYLGSEVYSTNHADYRISLINLGMEINMRGEPQNKVDMAIHGKDLQLWTTYTTP